MTDYGYIQNSPDAIKTMLQFTSPISVGMNASNQFLQFYKNGIYVPTDDKSEDPTKINHAVLLVGWGIQNNIPFWIVKNSWSPYWGEDGYFRVTLQGNDLGISEMACWVTVA